MKFSSTPIDYTCQDTVRHLFSLTKLDLVSHTLESAHQLKRESENCKRATESNLYYQVSCSSCFSHHSVD